MKGKIQVPTVNSGSMADIAFLLLIFFLVTTTITQEEGLTLKLPPDLDQIVAAEIYDRNLFKILINSHNEYLIEGEPAKDLVGVEEKLKKFILNRGEDPRLSDDPKKAIISIKANRGTDYGHFMEVLDLAKGVYYDLYAQQAKLTNTQYRHLDLSNPIEKDLYEKGRDGIPMNISIAEPEKASQ